jgi:hypothetical protein
VPDALEECDDRDELLRLTREIHGFSSLHLLATSRDELDITDVMSSLDTLKVAMDEDLVQEDIRFHIQQTLYRGNQYQKWYQRVKEEVRQH